MANKIPTVHNPTNFDPKDYEVVDYLDNRRPSYYGEGMLAYDGTVKFWEADMARVLGDDWRKKAHACIHCGNTNVRWITAVQHFPSGETVVFGSDCTARLGFPDKHTFKLAQLQAKDAARKVRVKVYLQREKFLADNPVFAKAIETIESPVHAKNTFAQDVVRKLGQYGSLSERQVSAVIASLARDVAKANPVEVVEVPKGDAPIGRVTVKGLVLNTKDQASDFVPGGWVKKMLLQLENNSRVWMTVPSKHDVAKGETVVVTATFTVSKDDKSFAFGARPSIVSSVAAA